MAIRADDPVGVVVDALITAGGVLASLAVPPMIAATAAATAAGSISQRFTNA